MRRILIRLKLRLTEAVIGFVYMQINRFKMTFQKVRKNTSFAKYASAWFVSQRCYETRKENEQARLKRREAGDHYHYSDAAVGVCAVLLNTVHVSTLIHTPTLFCVIGGPFEKSNSNLKHII